VKSKALLAAVFALALAAPPSHAAGMTWIGAGGGLNMPMGDFGDVASLGFFGGVSGTHMLNDQFGVGGDIHFHSFGVDDEFEEGLAVLAGESVDVSLSALQFTAHGTWMFPMEGDFKPYARLGLGFYNVGSKVEGGTFDSDDSETNFGFNLGLGGMFKTSDTMAIGGEVLYHSIMTEDEASNLITIGAKIAFGVGGK
jgi:opacity protein-like surface antigen